MSSASKQILQNDKEPKIKNPKCKAGQKEIKTSVETENTSAILNHKNVTKNSFEFFDVDFPALKNPGKFYSEAKDLELKNNYLVPALSYDNKETLNENSLSSNIKSFQKDVANNILRGNQLTQKTAENCISGAIKGKKDTSKKAPAQVQRNPNKKKHTDPILINFQDILTTNKIQRKAKHHNIVKSSAQRFKDKELLSGNLLDSSNPKRSRGKHREIKKKKLSNLKTTIIKERILKHKMRETYVDSNCANDCFNLIDAIDFKTEIKIYLNELNKKKPRSLDSSNSKLSEDENLKKRKEKQKNIENELVEKREDDFKNCTCDDNEKKISSFTAEEVKFSSKFREYCDNIVTSDLNTAVTVFIKELIKLQDRLFARDPVKAKARKRHVSGIREVKKYLTLKKVKMIIIAPNLEKLQMEGSIFDSITHLKSMADSQNVPYGFALDRYKLGKCTMKNVPVSAFAVLSFEGIETLYENVLRELIKAKKKFSELTGSEKEEKVNDINSHIISSLISKFREELQVSSDAKPRCN